MDKTNKIYKVTIDRQTLAKLYAAKTNYIKLSRLPSEKKDPSFDTIISWALDSLLNAQERVKIGSKTEDNHSEVRI